MANTAFVDNVFPSATPAVEDAANPFDTIAAALTAITAARGVATTYWRVVVRPGTYPETAAGNIITTLPNVDIIGSGASTIIDATVVNNVGAGPATIADVQVNVPSTASVTVDDALTVRDSAWFFTPSSSTVGHAFVLGGTGTPSLTMTGCTLSVLATTPTTTTTGFFIINGATGTSATLNVGGVRATQAGRAASVATFTGTTAALSVDIRDSVFGLTVYDPGTGTATITYGSTGTSVPSNIVWSVDDCEHTFTNGEPGVAPGSANSVAALTGFAFTPAATSQFVVHDSLFHYVNYPSTSPLYSGNDLATTAGNFIQMLDDKWTGFATSHVPPAAPGSAAVVYEGVSQRGTVATSGGMQTGVTTVPAASTAYTVADQDTIVLWGPTTGGTLTLPSSTAFIGKWVTVYNSNTPGASAPSVFISCTGTANNMAVPAQMSIVVQTNNGTNWFVAAGSPFANQLTSASTTQAVAPGASITASITTPAGYALTGGGLSFTYTAGAGAQWGVTYNGPTGTSGAPPTGWEATIVNTSTTVTMTTATITVYGIIL